MVLLPFHYHAKGTRNERDCGWPAIVLLLLVQVRHSLCYFSTVQMLLHFCALQYGYIRLSQYSVESIDKSRES
jgi:hypothetical protein